MKPQFVVGANMAQSNKTKNLMKSITGTQFFAIQRCKRE